MVLHVTLETTKTCYSLASGGDMRKTSHILLFLFLVLGAVANAAEPSLAGHWEGSIRLPGMELNVFLDFAETDGKWKGTIDIPAQAAKGLALINITISGLKTTFEIENVPGKPIFSGDLSNDGEKIT